MKSINKIITILLAWGVFVGFTACTEDADYSAAEKLTNAQVYFPNTNASKVNISFDKTSFDVEMRRMNTTDALTVPLQVENSTGLFTIPASVSFAAGSDVAAITIAYNPDDFEYDEYKPIKLSVTDATITTPYGKSEYTFEAGVPAPWESLGDASFSDTWSLGDTYEVEIQRHMLDPTRYRLVDPYAEGYEKEEVGYSANLTPYLEFTVLPAGSTHKGVVTTVDGLVVYDDFCTFYHTGYGADVYCMHPSRFTSMPAESFWLKNIVKQFSADGEPEVVQLAPMYYMFDIGGWDNSQSDGMITIVFPGVELFDYSAKITYIGRFTDMDDKDHAVADVTLGEDVEYAKVAMVEGRDIDSAVEGIIDGSLESKEISASGSVSFPCEATGDYSYVVVTYANDDAKESAGVSFKFTSSHDNTETWKSLGMAMYTDDYVGSIFKVSLATYEVEIQESEQNPGKFRLVNPYGAAFPHNEEGDWDTGKDYFMEINAMDPDGVFIELQNTGLNWGYGDFYVYSYAAYYLDNGKTPDEIKAAGLYGTYADGVITFPAETLLLLMTDDAEKLYDGNRNGAFKVVMPSAVKSTTFRSTATSHNINKKTVKATPVDKKQLKRSTFSRDMLLTD